VRTREDWAKRPMAERGAAAVAAWDRAANFTGEGSEPLSPKSYALDLPDAPAEAGPMPWRLQIATMLEAVRFHNTGQHDPNVSIALAATIVAEFDAASRAGGGA
jgi:hypothetical protein